MTLFIVYLHTTFFDTRDGVLAMLQLIEYTFHRDSYLGRNRSHEPLQKMGPGPG
jgi:hypothetical protein